MCISDWSSDVCSSDLLDLLGSGHDRSRSLAEEFFNGLATLGGHFRRIVHLGQCIHRRTHQIDRVTRTQRLGEHVLHPGYFKPGAHRRSEEHTSELQSLMRISYAVFCLKKKKHTKAQKRQYK